MKRLLVYLPFLVLAACGGNDEEAKNPGPEGPAPLEKSQNSEAFNASFEKMLNDYYALKDGLVKSTNSLDATVDPAAKALLASADSLKLGELKADSNIVSTARMFVETIASESKALLAEKGLEPKRKSFQMISDAVYNLFRTVEYDKSIAYYQYCPMAFNDQGAYWVSNSSEIRNPYFGNKMLNCGEVKDSLNYRVKK